MVEDYASVDQMFHRTILRSNRESPALVFVGGTKDSLVSYSVHFRTHRVLSFSLTSTLMLWPSVGSKNAYHSHKSQSSKAEGQSLKRQLYSELNVASRARGCQSAEPCICEIRVYGSEVRTVKGISAPVSSFTVPEMRPTIVCALTVRLAAESRTIRLQMMR